MAGRLTLSWVNKDQALVPEGQGRYSWVDRDDPRMTEVRLLHRAGGHSDGSPADVDNLLIQGDSYDALHALVKTPEFATRYRGKVKMVYIDPPFNTGQAFEHYQDSLEHSIWLGMMRERLLLIRELLAPDGSVWVHLDDAEMAYCKVLLDEIFGRGNFIANVIWQKIHARNNSAQHFSTVHDYILVYAKDKDELEVGRVDRTELSDSDFWNPDNDPRGRWRRSDLTASHSYEDGRYEVTGPHGDVFSPRGNRWWACSKETFESLRADDRLWWGKTGRTFPFRKRFESELGGLVPNTFWTHDEVGDNRQAKAEMAKLFGRDAIFSTPKPEKLLQRILSIGSKPGDIVLDCFAGSGTTAAVAHKMGRRWVTVELSPQTVATFTRPRIEKVIDEVAIDSDTLESVSESVPAGNGYSCLEVGPSLYTVVEGRLLLAEWAKGDEFAQAVATQLGFTFEPQQPFAGRKGRTRLAVLDGVADEVVIRAIVERLSEGERLVVVAKAVAPGTAEVLREISSGSRLLKAPRDLVSQGRIVR
ncbi:site-specific DNA-methyltransferase [Nocardia aurantia]|uniref:DNA methylase N-4/N-6 domain-containing protein n=1 Tax=Nocardia aurantia TaxID=2585199 RepID=A0A7K0E3N3_9NOCA|nr:site-specific DNA-methyltransferase [Nocardia aurantia]MQY32022.1 hypothetical protein [Nocardia aurantia]